MLMRLLEIKSIFLLSFCVFSTTHISMVVSHSFTSSSSPKYTTVCDYYLHGPPETLCFHCSRRKALFWVVVDALAKPRFRSLVPPSKDVVEQQKISCANRRVRLLLQQDFLCVPTLCINSHLQCPKSHSQIFPQQTWQSFFLKSRIKEVLWIFLLLLQYP